MVPNTRVLLQDIFLAIAAVVSKLAVTSVHAAQLGCMTAEVKQMEAVAQILLRKVDTESKYLARLEGKQQQLSCRCQMHLFAMWL